jgi:Glycogen debranching enzyme, glucanotransferase domain
VTTLNSKKGYASVKVPFVRSDKRTLVCNIIPKLPGLHSFRAEFSQDWGTTWLPDTASDAWVLIDPPQVKGLLLYTLIPAVSGTIADYWKADLKRISKMGLNAIHLLPITTQNSSESPYAARDLFDIDHSYLMEGSKKNGLLQLEEYIEEAIILDIKLCFDIVLNHVGVQSTMARQTPDWIVPDRNQPDGFRLAGYWSSLEWLTWKDLVLINLSFRLSYHVHIYTDIGIPPYTGHARLPC